MDKKDKKLPLTFSILTKQNKENIRLAFKRRRLGMEDFITELDKYLVRAVSIHFKWPFLFYRNPNAKDLFDALDKAIDQFEKWVKGLHSPLCKPMNPPGGRVTEIKSELWEGELLIKEDHWKESDKDCFEDYLERLHIASYCDLFELGPLYKFRNEIKTELSRKVPRGRRPEYLKAKIIAGIIEIYRKHFGRPGFTPYGPLHSIVIEAFDALGINLKDPSRLIKAELKVKD